MTNRTLGRLTRVDLRGIWATEASDFTPWLAREENLTVLSETSIWNWNWKRRRKLSDLFVPTSCAKSLQSCRMGFSLTCATQPSKPSGQRIESFGDLVLREEDRAVALPSPQGLDQQGCGAGFGNG